MCRELLLSDQNGHLADFPSAHQPLVDHITPDGPLVDSAQGWQKVGLDTAWLLKSALSVYFQGQQGLLASRKWQQECPC